MLCLVMFETMLVIPQVVGLYQTEVVTCQGKTYIDIHAEKSVLNTDTWCIVSVFISTNGNRHDEHPCNQNTFVRKP